MAELIFTVNPGATTTKCAFYAITPSGVSLVAESHLEHPDAILQSFRDISDQVDYREGLVWAFISAHLDPSHTVVACAGRGGMLTPVPSGAIKINPALVDFSLHTPVHQHASNLGAPLAYRVAQKFGVAAYIVDPVSVDEFTDVARISGCPEFERFSFVHALNIRATARKLAKQTQISFESLNCVVAHLGAGFSVAAIRNGRIADNDNRMESASFTPERAGGIPPLPLMEACFSGNYTKEELKKKLYGSGGVYAYLGTRDIREVEQRIQAGDQYAALIFDALIYQIGKSIAVMCSVLDFKMTGIILTGGLAYSQNVTGRLTRKFENVTDIYLFPGSNENESLAECTARIVQKQEGFSEWNSDEGIGDKDKE